MSNTFWDVVNNVIHDADVILLLLDARSVEETRHQEIEDKVKRLGKPLVYVITKCDLVPKTVVEKYKKTLKPCVFVSAIEHHGTTILRDRILIEVNKAKLAKPQVKVGVLGYPNVGKSSLINALKGRAAAPTSRLSGHTKGVQKIRIDNRILLLDTPGVIPYREDDDIKHTKIGTIDYTKTKNPDMVVLQLLQEYPGRIEKFYDVTPEEDPEETLEKIAKKLKMLMKGNRPDIERLARLILRSWQKGEIR